MNMRTNICFAVNTLIQYMVEPRSFHLVATKHVMRYMKGTIDYGLRYASDHEISLQGFTDSDWADSVADRKSTSGCYFNMRSTMISWFNKKQTSVALGTTEEEYIATCSASSEVVWLRKILVELFYLELGVTCI
jgi:hypothetical protein